MEGRWDRRIHALTHILTSPTTAPSLHSQLFIASNVLRWEWKWEWEWDYPPLLCSSESLLRWSLHLFLRRAATPPPSSWRSKCPFQQPPPPLLSTAVVPAPPQWGPEERRAYARMRMRRGRLGLRVPPLLAVALPNLLLLCLLFWDPIWFRR